MGVSVARAAGNAAVSVLKASPAGQAYSAAKGIISAPGKLLGSIFGGGPPAWKRSQTYRDYQHFRDLAKAGDKAAWQRLGRMMSGTKYPEIRALAANVYRNQGEAHGWAGSGGLVRTVAVNRRAPASRASASRARPAAKRGRARSLSLRQKFRRYQAAKKKGTGKKGLALFRQFFKSNQEYQAARRARA